MKKTLRWILGILLTPLLLFAVLSALLYLSPVQNWAAKKIAEYASEKYGVQITIDHVSLSPLFDLNVKNLHVAKNQQTLVDVEGAVVDLDFSKILKQKIGVEAIKLSNGTLDTQDLIAQVRLKGKLEEFYLCADEVNLKKQTININAAKLNGCDLDIALKDTSIIDTTENKPIKWMMDVGKMDIQKSRITLHTSNDSIHIQSEIQKASLADANIDFEKGFYRAKKITLKADSLHYNKPYEAVAEGDWLDYNHVSAKDIGISIDNTCYDQQTGNLTCNITRCQLKEKSGLEIQKLQTYLQVNNDNIQLTGLDLVTPHSTAKGNANLDWSSLTAKETSGSNLQIPNFKKNGQMDMDLETNLGKRDVMAILGSILPSDIKANYPDQPVMAKVIARGNVDNMQVDQALIRMPNVIDIEATGNVENLTRMEHMGADLNWDIQTHDLTCVRKYAKLDMRLPPMNISGNTRLQDGSNLRANATLQERKGTVHLDGDLNLKSMAYDARMNIKNLQIHDFLPKDSIYRLTANAEIKGKGTDIFSNKTKLNAHADISSLEYGKWILKDMDFTATVDQGKGMLDLNSHNELLQFNACAETYMDRNINDATFSLDLNHIDLYKLNLAKDTLAISMVMHMDGETNFNDKHQLKGEIQAIELITKDSIFHPEDIQLEATLDPQSIFATASAGDLTMKLKSEEGLDSLLMKTKNFTQELHRQFSEYHINQDTLTTLLPSLKMHILCGTDNPVSKIINNALGYSYKEFKMDMVSNPEKGINGNGHIQAFDTGAILLDTISWNIFQDDTGVSMEGRIKNGPKNRTVVFESLVNADITPTGATANLNFLDAKGKKGMDIGLRLDRMEDGMKVHFTPLNPIIAYRTFTLNEDNFVELTRDGRVDALIDLLADDGTGMKLYSTPNDDALQDISLSINNFNLGELSQVLPYLPDIQGLLHGDLHYVQTESNLSVSADMGIKDMVYEGTSMGNIGFNGVYLPNSDGSHYVDAIMTQEENEIMAVSGRYFEEKNENHIDASAILTHLPLKMANGYIPDDIAALAGYVNGEVDITGNTSNLILNGALRTDSMHVVSDLYSINLRIPDDTIRIENSKIYLDKIEAYTKASNPMTLNGNIDCQNLEQIKLNLTIQAQNYELINAPKNRNALAYGKVFVNMNGMMRGTLDDLRIRGRLTVLGNTDVTYVLKDSPITVEDRLEDLVTFVNFNDTTEYIPAKTQKAQNVDMSVIISIEQAAQVNCLLSEDGHDYVKLEGGGDLTMTYNTQNDLRMYGRYTIISGSMNYTLISVVNKNFDIENGSYVEFTGDIMNPTLKISANERMKATYSENNIPRSVTFDVGLNITQTLKNMGLEFTLDAPEDMTVQNELASMSSEDRGRVAVTMMATNMYITDLSNTAGFNTSNALNSFLQSEINNLVGMAQNTIDVNFGIENNTSETGRNQTDYNFSFAKRFWGNRINLIVGGKVSTGADAVNTGESIIDNVSLEYRLDQSATRYVKVYYDRNYESLLEGELAEMGAGVVFRKKSKRLRDIFRFRNKKKEAQTFKVQERKP